MSQSSNWSLSPTLDAAVEAYEQALAQGGDCDLAEFAPNPSSPVYRPILRELIRVDLEFHWGRGQPRPLAEYRRRFPEYFKVPANVQPVAFEEYRLRRQVGQNPSPRQYEQDYGICTAGWPAPDADPEDPPLSVQLEGAAQEYREFRLRHGNQPDEVSLGSWFQSQGGTDASRQIFQDLYHSSPALADRVAEGLVAFPREGDDFLGFKLLRSLGSGAFGRVFLAKQAALADRLVVLKIGPDLGGEPQKLAQLQHTHIVPVYSVHQQGALQAVCMPFLGSRTLADIELELRSRATRPLSGAELLSTLQQRSADALALPPTELKPTTMAGESMPNQPMPSAVLKKLEGLSYVEAVLWLGSCLAEGLAHAHERGIFHRDVKPANVLVTDEGQPLLLDFNLAEDTKRIVPSSLVGGTLQYMAPEHLRAFAGDHAQVVDGQADIYSLGIILYELLTGRPPFGPPALGPGSRDMVERLMRRRLQLPPSPRHLNRLVSPAVASVVQHCLEPDPARRYQMAHHLHEDLQRQLEWRPLKYAAEPSLRERLHKQIKRSPRLPVWAAAAVAVCLLLVASGLWLRAHYLGHKRLAEANLKQFHQDQHRIQFALNTNQSTEQKKAGLDQCRQTLDRYGVLTEPDWRRGSLYTYLAPDQQERLEKELGSLLLVYIRTGERLQPDSDDGQTKKDFLEESLRLNAEAARCLESDGQPSKVVLEQRIDLLEKLGQKEQARPLRKEIQKLSLRSAQDLYNAAREFTVRQQFREAKPLLLQATRLDPQNYWAWFLLGYTCGGLNDEREAVKAYTVCIALDPSFHGAYFNRGLAHLQKKDFENARKDFDQVIEREERLAESYINRAFAWQGLQQYRKAEADLTQALAVGASTGVYFQRARVRLFLKDKRGYQHDMEQGLRRTPTDEPSWLARGLARMKENPQGALKDFDEALKLNPASWRARLNKAHVFSEILHQPREALKALNQLIDIYPDFARAWDGRGIEHARLGDREAAYKDAKKALELDDGPRVLYQAGCVYALTSKFHPPDKQVALKYLSTAVRQGYGADLLAGDPDLNPLRDLPEFRELQQAAAVLQKTR
jgi:serine/threonine protein kinase/Tfp pilus assembly protein PilF